MGDAVAYPFYMLRTWFQSSESAIPFFFRSRAALEAEIASMRDQRSAAEYDELRLRSLEEENANLREATEVGVPRIVADVVRRPNETPYDTLIINKGAADGVKESAIVYGRAESAIGSVRRVFAKSSLVVLFSTPGELSPVYIYGPNIFARAEGIGGGVLRVEVPQGIEIAVGDPVVVPAARGVYGAIDHIESSPSNPAQYAFVAQEPAMTALRFVSVDQEPLANMSRTDIEAMLLPAKEATSSHPGFVPLLKEIEDAIGTTTTVH